MSFEKVPEGFTHTFRASTGLRQYQFVNLASTTSVRIARPTTNGVHIGVLISSGTTGSTGRAGSTDSGSVQTVQFAGIAKVLAGSSAIDAGGYVKASTDGLAAPTTGPTSTSFVGGRALEAVTSTSTSQSVFAVLINHQQGFGA